MKPGFGLLGATFLCILVLIGCDNGPSEPSSEEDLLPLRIQLDWRPEPQHGGLYQALVDGFFEEAGLEVQLIPGGTNILVPQKVATGEAEIGQSATTQVVQFRKNGYPLKNVAGVFHHAPSGLLMHESNPIDSFEDLDGKRIMARPEAVYIPYLKDKYGIDFEVTPQSFGLGGFLSDPSFIQEGFYIAEPYFLEQKGADVKWLPLKDAGYSPYAVLFSTDSFLQEHPEKVRAFVKAYIRGWETYLGDGYSRAHAAMKRDNDTLTDGFLEFSRNQILENHLVRGDPEKGETIASLDPDRIQREISIMESIGVLEPGQVSVDSVLDLSFLPESDADPEKAGSHE
mgnify:CR=1 FL=1